MGAVLQKLSRLKDVVLSSPSDGQTLVYNSATGKWVNGAGSGGSDDQTAAEVPFTPAGTIVATNVQAAVEEVASDVGSLPRDITQVAHGLSVGNAVRFNGTAYVKAQADTAPHAEVVGIVSAVASANAFTLISGGHIGGLAGLTAGEVYFLSPSVAGALTATEPSTAGQVSKPLFLADSTTSGYFVNFRGSVVPGSGGGGATAHAYNYFGSITGASSPIALASGGSGSIADWVQAGPAFYPGQAACFFDLTDPLNPVVLQSGNYSYEIEAQIFGGAPGTGYLNATLYEDAAGLDDGPGASIPFAAVNMGLLLAGGRYLAAGMVVQLALYQTSGSPVSVATWMKVNRELTA